MAAIPASVTSLNLSWNVLNSSSAGLAQAFATIPANVISLDLSWNLLGFKHCAELARVFSSLPNHVASLNLCFNPLNELPIENLMLLKDSLKHVQTIYLSHSIIENMSKEQRQALGSAFPNIQKIILVDDNYKEIHPSQSITISNLIRELSGKTDAPSLLNQCILFAQKHQTNIERLNIPEELKESVRTFNPH